MIKSFGSRKISHKKDQSHSANVKSNLLDRDRIAVMRIPEEQRPFVGLDVVQRDDAGMPHCGADAHIVKPEKN